MKIGGSDMADTAKWFCTATGPQRVALARQAAGLPRLPTVQEGPIKLFDNLTYIGFNDVGAWVVPTSAGLILFDTLNSTADAMNVIEPEMQKAGFDPAQIKYILARPRSRGSLRRRVVPPDEIPPEGAGARCRTGRPFSAADAAMRFRA